MSDREFGVLYTEHSDLTAATPIASLWSYGSRARGHDRRPVARNLNGACEYWLERSDPLLNTILPGTCVSLVINFDGAWAAGRSLSAAALLPSICVVGPVTRARILRVGRSVHAIGACVVPTLAHAVFGVPTSDLADQIVPLRDLWTRRDVEKLLERVSDVEIRRAVSALKTELLARIGRRDIRETVAHTASRLIALRRGRVSIDELAISHGLGRQTFARRFCTDAGLPPKLFARITRFQTLVHALLSTDVSRWASLPPAIGFYDQAHMINEFRAFAGSSPTMFFQPHDGTIDRGRTQIRGRPGEWQTRSETALALRQA